MRCRTGRSGFSLLELMIAIGVIAVALMGVMSMIITATRNKERMRELALGREAATLKMEEIRSQPFATVLTKYASPNDLFNVETLHDPTNTAGGRKGRGEIRIISTNPELLDITVVVRWLGISGKAQEHTVRSLYAR